MPPMLGIVAVAYLAGTGLLTNSAVVARGLFRSGRQAVQGHFEEAVTEALAAVVAPVVLTTGATLQLVQEVIGCAEELTQPALDAADAGLPCRSAA